MWSAYAVISLCCLLGVVVFYARQDGKKTARLAALKKEAKEAARVQDIRHRVGGMPLADVRRLLHRGKH